jgi:tellurite resistance protein TehA-like permease
VLRTKFVIFVLLQALIISKFSTAPRLFVEDDNSQIPASLTPQYQLILISVNFLNRVAYAVLRTKFVIFGLLQALIISKFFTAPRPFVEDDNSQIPASLTPQHQLILISVNFLNRFKFVIFGLLQALIISKFSNS